MLLVVCIHDTLAQCWGNVGPASSTLSQHCPSTGWMSRVICLLHDVLASMRLFTMPVCYVYVMMMMCFFAAYSYLFSDCSSCSPPPLPPPHTHTLQPLTLQWVSSFTHSPLPWQIIWASVCMNIDMCCGEGWVSAGQPISAVVSPPPLPLSHTGRLHPASCLTPLTLRLHPAFCVYLSTTPALTLSILCVHSELPSSRQLRGPLQDGGGGGGGPDVTRPAIRSGPGGRDGGRGYGARPHAPLFWIHPGAGSVCLRGATELW